MWTVSDHGHDPLFGHRHLHRVIQKREQSSMRDEKRYSVEELRPMRQREGSVDAVKVHVRMERLMDVGRRVVLYLKEEAYGCQTGPGPFLAD